MGLSTTLLAAATPTDGFTGWVVRVMEMLGEPGAGLLVALENLFPPIPSEVILPLAGFSASVGTLNLYWAIVCTTIGSLVGAWCLYGLGVWLGRDRLLRLIDWMPLVDVEDMLKANGGLYEKGADFAPHVVTDVNLVTGQNPASSAEAATALLGLLGGINGE